MRSRSLGTEPRGTGTPTPLYSLQREINVYFEFRSKFVCSKCSVREQYLRRKLILERIEMVYVYRESKLSCLFVFNAVTLSHIHSDCIDMDGCLSCVFFYHAAHHMFVFPIHSLLDIRKRKKRYVYTYDNRYFCANVRLLNKRYDPN